MNTPGTQLHPVQAGGEAERGMEMGCVCVRAQARRMLTSQGNRCGRGGPCLW